MQSKGLSLKMQFLLLSCVLSMVLAVVNADSSESSGSDSMEDSSTNSDSMENQQFKLLKTVLRFLRRPGFRGALRAYQAQV